MSKWMQFVFAAYAPMVARFNLVEPAGCSGSVKEPARRPSESPGRATLPERRETPALRRAPKKPRTSMAA